MGRKRRKRRRAKDKTSNFWALATVGVLGIVWWLGQQISQYPVQFGLAGAVLLVGGALVVRFRWLRAREDERRQAERDALISSTDGMSGQEFENWTARLLAASGCVNVAVVGGAGDAGADVLAYTVTGQRVVVQCKRYAATKVSSPDVQRFAGTARYVHGGQIAMIVTTASFTKPAVELAVRAGIVLVDRDQLADWARTGAPPSWSGLSLGDAPGNRH